MGSEMLYKMANNGVLQSVFMLSAITEIIILIASMKLFKKAGFPAWMALIPILSVYKMHQIMFWAYKKPYNLISESSSKTSIPKDETNTRHEHHNNEPRKDNKNYGFRDII